MVLMRYEKCPLSLLNVENLLFERGVDMRPQIGVPFRHRSFVGEYQQQAASHLLALTKRLDELRQLLLHIMGRLATVR
jgi:hypothetical protein